MTTPQSPSRFNGLYHEDDLLYSELNFTEDISQKMRVPKRIKATGEYSDDDHLLSNQNGIMNSWNYNDKIDMNVPDRIVVIGQDQHLGIKSAPREIVLENSILPKDPGFVRVATPPRVITLNQHHFPSASDDDAQEKNNREFVNDGELTLSHVIKANNYPTAIGFNPNETMTPIESVSEQNAVNNSSRKVSMVNYGDTSLMSQMRDGTPPGNLSPSEEVMHLRRQLTKLNRRVHCIELDNLHRQQREKIIYCLGLAYFLLKTIFWLNRN